MRSKTPLTSIDCLRGLPRPILRGCWPPRWLRWLAPFSLAAPSSLAVAVGGRRDERPARRCGPPGRGQLARRRRSYTRETSPSLFPPFPLVPKLRPTWTVATPPVSAAVPPPSSPRRARPSSLSSAGYGGSPVPSMRRSRRGGPAAAARPASGHGGEPPPLRSSPYPSTPPSSSPPPSSLPSSSSGPRVGRGGARARWPGGAPDRRP